MKSLERSNKDEKKSPSLKCRNFMKMVRADKVKEPFIYIQSTAECKQLLLKRKKFLVKKCFELATKFREKKRKLARKEGKDARRDHRKVIELMCSPIQTSRL